MSDAAAPAPKAAQETSQSGGEDEQPLQLFFITGPLRTGSSLMARCIDDHEDAICLCESEITRTLYPEHYLKLHVRRMTDHGFSGAQIIDLLERKRQNSVNSLLHWYMQVCPLAQQIYNKPHINHLGDKSPDIYRSKALVDFLAPNFPLIHTIRDPRAIMRSIYAQTSQSEEVKAARWEELRGNIEAWAEHLDKPNILISKYEDLVRAPEVAMGRVYAHLGLKPSTRFTQAFERLHPRRFLWETAIDWKSGVRKAFDPAKAEVSDADLTDEQRARVYDDPLIKDFMDRFDYG